jgi:hypothetical protein
MSKESVVTASSRSSGLKPGVRCIDRRKFRRAACVTSTPLGAPVEPEV